ncbi:MAG: Xaa-Pro peptidase family protein [Acidobacteriia bacterium]|nr:Xaa-Pro peptidase family protein [Terriglobia bacterium]
MDHKGRQKRLQGALGPSRLDGLLVVHLPNIRYLCGFTGSAGTLLITEEKSLFFTDGRYTTQARAEVQGARVVIRRKPPLVAVAEWLTANRRTKGHKGLWRLGIEGEHLTVAGRSRLAGALPSNVRLKEAPPLVEEARMVKDAEEIERLRAAVMLGAGLFDCALTAIRPGVKEAEVAAEMEYAARRKGADQMSFETIIASGERSALPHGRASDAPIPAAGFVVCDFGVILAGYCSDMTRTVYVGRPTDEARGVYEAVREAQQAAVAAVRPGVSVGEVDGAARKLLQRNGLVRNFTHSTGHGVGLEIHEAPRVASGQTETLHPGMVITIEPGVYIPGKWGVRIEDMVVVTERGCEVLTPTSKELIAIA